MTAQDRALEALCALADQVALEAPALAVGDMARRAGRASMGRS